MKLMISIQITFFTETHPLSVKELFHETIGLYHMYFINTIFSM